MISSYHSLIQDQILFLRDTLKLKNCLPTQRTWIALFADAPIGTIVGPYACGPKMKTKTNGLNYYAVSKVLGKTPFTDQSKTHSWKSVQKETQLPLSPYPKLCLVSYKKNKR